ncbi:hypothetical protein PFLUV_G00161160 [Perca fluviatilis]|uniref:UPAR/Ly6 domain-containing protein n=1 Tax=Perca fluviatilis TaxID=8168 RepID=A0A6A5E1U4_PERFL|nr:phospholipase A2 inhibitor CNF-like [Perca fluviatilis]KAF1382121.1 hypothetical protein PFLUV_G00161160 [Perca fluviatilis]
MYLLALMFGILLLPEASTLRCYACFPGDTGTCIQTECHQGQQCATTRIVAYSGGSKYDDKNLTGCAMAEDCFNASVNFGIQEIKFTTMCCTAALCNSQPAPEPSKSKPNGKQCYWCDGRTCTNILNCEGNEDNCITLTESRAAVSVTMKGCVSKQLCTTRDPSWAGGLPFTCCEGNLCNGASSQLHSSRSECLL